MQTPLMDRFSTIADLPLFTREKFTSFSSSKLWDFPQRNWERFLGKSQENVPSQGLCQVHVLIICGLCVVVVDKYPKFAERQGNFTFVKHPWEREKERPITTCGRAANNALYAHIRIPLTDNLQSGWREGSSPLTHSV